MSAADVFPPADQASFTLRLRTWEALGLTLSEFAQRWHSGGDSWTDDPIVLQLGGELDALDQATSHEQPTDACAQLVTARPGTVAYRRI
jgi:hypothetical protein